MVKQPFSPAYGQTQTVTVSSTPTPITVDPLAKQVMFTNANAFIVFVRCYDVANPVAATVKDYPILPNSKEVITKNGTFGGISLLSTLVNTGPVLVTPGEGYLSATT
ncbi:hypothetical protein PIN31009_05544 [Pandoraea iniqua]|uniref:hypothetical protein n=1 Tax=Pandoraea iniqua TaxID=2508288 RepID=UPI0012418987|nr:hypothetical protein [Pandoraea iniqua]VVE59461.1 hypothetical protein PIN31009_05544 [Pandoraea iniqua]